jgi:hypothetical protein
MPSTLNFDGGCLPKTSDENGIGLSDSSRITSERPRKVVLCLGWRVLTTTPQPEQLIVRI